MTTQLQGGHGAPCGLCSIMTHLQQQCPVLQRCTLQANRAVCKKVMCHIMCIALSCTLSKPLPSSRCGGFIIGTICIWQYTSLMQLYNFLIPCSCVCRLCGPAHCCTRSRHTGFERTTSTASACTHTGQYPGGVGIPPWIWSVTRSPSWSPTVRHRGWGVPRAWSSSTLRGGLYENQTAQTLQLHAKKCKSSQMFCQRDLKAPQHVFDGMHHLCKPLVFCVTLHGSFWLSEHCSSVGHVRDRGWLQPASTDCWMLLTPTAQSDTSGDF